MGHHHLLVVGCNRHSAAAGSYDTDAAFYYDGDRSFSDSSFATSNPINVSKSSSVAKIKVVVRKRPLNRKEISRKEDDIITVDAYASSLTVHETKLKVIGFKLRHFRLSYLTV
ncbi:hypothetical protein HU200_060571 [Digitaria exilis]|uniref:Kinesin motor domain-containing protein n=1 Tax=Digitaria exilis TaxID=1010633 RepID=A0A835A935_9POAL|nr:hypothetical protein HU200_060571 [Digitaria exilis]